MLAVAAERGVLVPDDLRERLSLGVRGLPATRLLHGSWRRSSGGRDDARRSLRGMATVRCTRSPPGSCIQPAMN